MRKPTYKPPSIPSFRVEEWYSSLEKPFRRTYIPTAPDFETGMSSIREFDREYPHIDEELFVFADYFLTRHFSQIKSSVVMSHEDILIHMNKTTSPGFPFSKTKKREYLYDAAFQQHILDLENDLITTHVPFVWKWAQKYELRTIEKAKARKIRGFCVAPVDHAYLQSKFFTNFNENFFDLSDEDEFPSAVGMSKYYLGFDNLARYIMKHPNIFSTDFSGFDSTISPQLMEWVFHYKLRWCKFSSHDLEIVWGLVMSNIFSIVILENGDIVIKQGGNPSGQSNTIVDNTLIQIVLFIMGYRHALRGQPHKLTFTYFSNNVCFKCFGDDCIFSVSDEVLPFFNFKVWRDFLSPLGFTLKGNEEPSDIFGAEFLSHHIIDYRGCFLPVPDTEKLLNSLLLGGTSDNPLYLLMRAHSIRIEVWPDEPARKIVESYISYFYSHYRDDLAGRFEIAKDQFIDLEMIKGFYFTDDEILALYMGYESGCGKLLNYLGHIKNYLLDIDSICSDIPIFHFSLFSELFVPRYQSYNMATVHADRSLDLLENTTGLSRHGKAFLTAAIDPFHDESIPDLCGFPDGSCSRSVVQIVRASTTIRKPSSVTGTGWDLHIISYPHLNVTEYVRGSSVSKATPGVANTTQPGDIPIFMGTYTPTTTQYVRFGGICAYANPVGESGSNPFNGGTGVQEDSKVFSLTPDNTFTTGNYRCFAKGYEVMSVGAELTKSGTAHIWQQPTDSNPGVTSYCMEQVTPATGAVSLTNYYPMKTYDFLPSSVDEAVLIPDTKTWPAKKGAYIVDRLNTACDFSANSPDNGIIYKGESTDVALNVVPAVASRWGTGSVQLPGVTGQTIFPSINTSDCFPFNHSGVYLTGLNDADVIVITGIWYIERIPSDNQKNLVVLAQPSPLRDDVALNIYSVMSAKMPVGMYQDANSFGDWFKDAVSTVTDTVAPALSMMPGPLGMVGKAVTVGGGLLNKVLNQTKSSPSNVSTIESSLKELKKEEARPLRKASGRATNGVKALNRAVQRLDIVEKKMKNHPQNGQKKKKKKNKQ